MGQQASLPEGPRPHGNLRTFWKGTGSLGLSKAELEKRCKPSGLYPSCKWEDKAIRKLIGDGKLAARLKGHEHRITAHDQECPICFLQYSQINKTKCCGASICSECYLQVRPPKQKTLFDCPFCNSPTFAIAVAQTLDEAGIKQRAVEEQKTLEASARARANTVGSVSTTDGDEASENAFGTSLAQNERVQLMRKCTESYASSDDSGALEADIHLLAMTPAERDALREEIQAQALHPLAMRVEQEEFERRIEREQEYYERQARRLQQIRAQRERLRATIQQRYGTATANAMMRRTSRGDRGVSQLLAAQGLSTASQAGSLRTLEDYVVLEATMRLNLQEETRIVQETGIVLDEDDADGRPRWHFGDSRSRRDMVLQGLSEEEQLAMAIQASLRESAAAVEEVQVLTDPVPREDIDTEAPGEPMREISVDTASSSEVLIALGFVMDSESERVDELSAIEEFSVADPSDDVPEIDGLPAAEPSSSSWDHAVDFTTSRDPCLVTYEPTSEDVGPVTLAQSNEAVESGELAAEAVDSSSIEPAADEAVVTTKDRAVEVVQPVCFAPSKKVAPVAPSPPPVGAAS